MRTRRRLIAAGAALLVLVGGALTGIHWAGLDSLPDPAFVLKSSLPNDTLIYDRTGTVLLADIAQPGQHHTDVPLSAMGRWLPLATVAVDDPGFWSEPGVDPGRLARAAWDAARGQPGADTGSTIILRLIRLRLLATSTATGKARATALAVRVAAAVPKAKILESYLDSLPYGNNAIGVEAAAITYFQVDASQLDLAQASLLAGLPQAPALLEPLNHLPSAKRRQREVLEAMVRARSISHAEADQALAEPLHLTGPASLDVAPQLVGEVVSELTTRYGPDALHAGLTVLTTLDWGLQQQADQALRQGLDVARAHGANDAALAATDPRTGDVLALAVQGSNAQFAFASHVPTSPGNAFRVFAYAAAIASHRYTMVTPIADAPIRVDVDGKTSYSVLNYDRQYHGTCELRACLGNGWNVPAVEVEMATGLPAVATLAGQLGAPPYSAATQADGTVSFRTDNPPSSYGPSLTLGGYPETPLAMAAGLGTLANEGAQHPARTILRVTVPDGTLIFQARGDAGKQVLDPGAAFVVSEMLGSDDDRALTYGRLSALAMSDRHVAALAGTSENFHDGYAAGYTPSLAAAVWVGNATLAPMTPGSDGVIVAAPAWHRFMQGALDQLGRGDEWYTAPAGVQSATVNGRQAWFLLGTSAATPAPPMPAGVQVGT